jgi:hypothetical protein
MKKIAFFVLLLVVFGAGFMPATPPPGGTAQEPAAQPISPPAALTQAVHLERAVHKAIFTAPHYGIFDSLSFQMNGIDVILTGQVTLPITREEVFRRVSKLPGVGEVVDAVKVLPLSRSDDALRHRVYRRLFGSAGLYRYALGPDPSIHIIVRNGRVTLEGAVSSEGDRRFAANAARSVFGIAKVTNNLKVEG